MKKVIIIACIALCAAFLCGGRVGDNEPKEPPALVVMPVDAVDEPSNPWDNANRIEGCLISHYCCERYEHDCGTGDGFTATGTEVTAGRSCAVDPLLIPLGSTVWVDVGGEIREYIAEDVGGAVNGAHIDLAVETHDEANDKGIYTTTVWWRE